MPQTLIFKMVVVISNIFLLLAVFLLYVLKERFKNSRKTVKSLNAGLIFCLALMVAQYAVYVDARYLEPNWIKVERLRIENQDFPDELSKLKLVHISDLHIWKEGFRERSLIAKINALKPDIIVITGDFLYRDRRKNVSAAMSVLSALRAAKGIYGVFGDADLDMFGADIAGFKTALHSAGVHILDNENIRIPLGNGEGLWLIGLTRGVVNKEALRLAYSGVNLSQPKILLCHYPTVVDSGYINPENVDLLLAGDTHGGQTGLKFLRDSSAMVRKNKYISGLFNIKGVPLYVNRGIGMSHKNIRFFCRPEITLITLSPGIRR